MSDPQTNTNADGLSITRRDDFDDWRWEEEPLPENFVQRVSISAAKVVMDEICESSWIGIHIPDSGEMAGQVVIEFMALSAELVLSTKFSTLIDRWIDDNVAGVERRCLPDDEALIMIKELESAIAKIRAVL